MPRRSKRHVVGFIADPHCNSLLGLLNPKTILTRDDNGVTTDWTPNPTPAQEWLWDAFTKDLAALSRFVGKDSLTLCVAGDVTDGVKHLGESVSMRPSDQVAIASQALLPAFRLKQLSRMYLVKGTDAHEMLAGSLSILTADALKNKVPVETYYHPLLSFNNGKATVDVSHHGPAPGIRAWLKGNEVRYYLRDIMLQALQDGEKPPDAVVRAHRHVYTATITEVQTNIKTYFTLGLILPPYCLATSHIRQVGKSPQSLRVGMIALEIIDGVLNLHPWESLHYLDLRTERKI